MTKWPINPDWILTTSNLDFKELVYYRHNEDKFRTLKCTARLKEFQWPSVQEFLIAIKQCQIWISMDLLIIKTRKTSSAH